LNSIVFSLTYLLNAALFSKHATKSQKDVFIFQVPAATFL